ncbi:MAG: diheme cytochrome c [Pseudomonadota bacterium]
MLSKHNRVLSVMGAAVLLLGVTTSFAWADDDGDDDEGRYERAAMVSNSSWQEECGSCHIAFPPRMLPAQSWRELMAGLDDHFGSDASLDQAVSDEITTFLENNASSKKVRFSGKSTLRITDTREFRSEHDEISARTWNNPKVKTASNCSACHSGAERGDFSERNVKVPR